MFCDFRWVANIALTALQIVIRRFGFKRKPNLRANYLVSIFLRHCVGAT